MNKRMHKKKNKIKSYDSVKSYDSIKDYFSDYYSDVDNEELQKIISMDYLDLCKHLQNKYNIPRSSYFLSPSYKEIYDSMKDDVHYKAKDLGVSTQTLLAMSKRQYVEKFDTKPKTYMKVKNAEVIYELRSKDTSLSRTKEGLVIHHIGENEHILLGNPNFAVKQDFAYQLPENLCYCDYLEHLLLHIKIVEEYFDMNSQEQVGIGGVALIIEQFESFSSDEREWCQQCRSKVENNYGIEMFQMLVDYCKKSNPIISLYLESKEEINSLLNILAVRSVG